ADADDAGEGDAVEKLTHDGILPLSGRLQRIALEGCNHVPSSGTVSRMGVAVFMEPGLRFFETLELANETDSPVWITAIAAYGADDSRQPLTLYSADNGASWKKEADLPVRPHEVVSLKYDGERI